MEGGCPHYNNIVIIIQRGVYNFAILEMDSDRIELTNSTFESSLMLVWKCVFGILLPKRPNQPMIANERERERDRRNYVDGRNHPYREVLSTFEIRYFRTAILPTRHNTNTGFKSLPKRTRTKIIYRKGNERKSTSFMSTFLPFPLIQCLWMNICCYCVIRYIFVIVGTSFLPSRWVPLIHDCPV